MTTIYRPVEASPPQRAIPVIDPKTGRFTEYGHKMVTELWKRTGGFTDDVGALLGLVAVSQVSSLTASSNEEKTRRQIGEALQQVQGQNAERLRSLFDDIKKTSDAHFGQLLGGLARPPQTRVIAFDQSDTWRLNPDVRAIRVILVAGGGGGGCGSGTSSGAGGGGGAGGGYSTADFNAAELPASVAVTVGAGGAGQVFDVSGVQDGGNSSFGAFAFATGGDGGGQGGPVLGNGGASLGTYGSLYYGGNGGDGLLVSGDSAPNDAPGAPGGGGGGGYNGGNGGAGGAGSWRATAATGGGGAGGATGTNGSPGVLPSDAEVYLGPGFGGGGGGGASTGDGGNGADGILGGGGGGGGAIGTAGTTPGNGGNGGSGRVWVLEYY